MTCSYRFGITILSHVKLCHGTIILNWKSSESLCSYKVRTFIQARELSTVKPKQVSKKIADHETLLKHFAGGVQEVVRIPKHVISKKEGQSDTFTIENLDISNKTADAETFQKPKKIGMDVAKAIRSSKNAIEAVTDQHQDNMRRIIKATQMPNLSVLGNETLARMIRKSLIYADDKLVVLNKPYGLPVHGGDGITKCLTDVLPMVSKMIYGLNTEVPLTVCHRLDRYTTGVLVCSADSTLTDYLVQVFRRHEVVRKYWTIVIGTPNPVEGLIDIPLTEKRTVDRVSNKSYARMAAHPRVRYDEFTGEETRVASTGGFPAMTHYRIMDVSSGLSLLELSPETSAKHQLRVHMADCLACPIVGDHKYSEFGKLAPQRLPGNILRRFGIPQTKTRNIPLHLFHSRILIPDVFPDKRKPHLIIGASIPSHMHRTMKMFGLRPGKPSEWKIKTSPAPEAEAEPRDPGNPLYVDITKTSAPVPRKDRSPSEKDCIKVFRPRIAVKYKRF